MAMNTKAIKAVVGAVAMLATAVAVQAAEWETVARVDNETVYLDLDSLRMVEGVIEGRVMHNYDRARTIGDSWYAHRSREMTYRFDCAAGELGYRSFAMWRGELGTGEQVFAGKASADMYAADPDQGDVAMMSQVCSAAKVARAGRQSGGVVAATK
jgi:hypothetical protein